MLQCPIAPILLPAQRKKSSGAALILVLWLMVALSLIVLAGARSARTATQDTAMGLDRMRAQSLLDGAMQTTTLALLRDRSGANRYRTVRLQLQGVDVQVEVTPSEGLIDVHTATRPLLRSLFERAGNLSPEDATVMAARVADFIDADDNVDPEGGAEAPEYAAAGMPAGPRNGAIDDPIDLLGVLGMTPALYARIAPFLGINGVGSVLLEAAPPKLIDILTDEEGLGQSIHDAPPETRATMLPAGQEQLLRAGKGGGGTLRLRARATMPDGRRWSLERWVDLSTRTHAITPWTTRWSSPVQRTAASE